MRPALRSATGLLLLLILWSGGSSIALEDASTVGSPSLPHLMLAPAPEFPVSLQWLNTDRPLRLRELRGKVVLLDFWTYGCINCLHILPDLQHLEATYARELVVIGVHSAKYDNEAIFAHLRHAVRRYGITHPVVNDRDFALWKAYRVTGWPTQILIDPTGHLLQSFVGENHRQRLSRLIAATVALHRQKGTLQDDAVWPRDVSAEVPPTSLLYPGNVLADAAASRLFIADTQHHRLVMTDLHGNVLAVIGHGRAGAADGSFAQATFRQPQGMALQDSMLYVADTGNHLLRRLDLIRHEVTTMVGTGKKAQEFNVPGYGREVSLNSPWDLYRQESTLYIAMAGMHQIWRLNLHTAYVEPFAGSGSEALIDAPHLEAALGQPSGLSGDGQRLYVADSEVNAVRIVDLNPDGTTTTLAGGGLFTFGDRDGIGSAGRMQHPLGVTYADGAVYVADTYNHKIKHLDPQSGRLQTLAGTGRAGYRDGPAAEAQFYEPGGVSASGGKLYVADTNNHCVRVIDLATLTITTLPLHGLASPETTPPSSDQNSEVMQLTEQSLPATSHTTLHLDLRFPPGWKVNEQAPATLTIAVTGDGLCVPPTSAKQTLLPLSPHQSVALRTAQDGTRAWLRVDLAFVACQQSLCVPRQVTWEVPVRSQTGAASSDLTLHYHMPSL